MDLACRLVECARRWPVAPKEFADPILGDWPKGLYLDETAATSIRDKLVSLAHVLTPNLFELGWLTGRRVTTLADALAATTELGSPGIEVAVTSPPVSAKETGVLSVASDGITLYRTPHLRDVPHGVGDLFSGLIAAGHPVGGALGHVQALVRASAGFPHLRIVEAAGSWKHAVALKGDPYPVRSEV